MGLPLSSLIPSAGRVHKSGVNPDPCAPRAAADGIAPKPMDQAKITTNFQIVFSHLSELNLQIDLNPRIKGDVYCERYFEPLFQILSSATRLKRLAFGVTQWRFTFDVHHTQRLLANTWPDLEALKLRCLRVDPDTLLNFFARHKAKLTTLCLQHVGFEPDTLHTWLDLAQRGGELLRLDYAELDVYEWSDGSEINRQDNSTATDLGVLLVGGYAATPSSCDLKDGETASGGREARTSAKASQAHGRRKEICDRCGRWLQR